MRILRPFWPDSIPARMNFPHVRLVQSFMEKSGWRLGAPEWLILVGGSGFIVVLFVSAYFEADIRWLHFFQAWMYVATIALGLRGNRWGHFIGLSAAGFWNYANLFVTTFLAAGLQQLSIWFHTGRLPRPDLFIAVPAWSSNLLVILGCLWAYSRNSKKSRSDLAAFLVAFVLTTAFFAADMALFQPRYLGLFPRLLHPHLPWIR